MNTEETKQVVHHINEGVERMLLIVGKIKTRININTGIFSIALLILCWTIWMGYKLNAKQERNYNIANESLKQSAATNAKLDATDNLYTGYIKTTVGQILDKLQKDNPQLNVPKAPAPRPPGLPPLSEQELERPRNERPKPSPTATASPIIKTRTVVKYRSKPKPTPRPWHWPWDVKQTR